jgi:cytochrome P450
MSANAGVFVDMNEFFPAAMRRNPFLFYAAHREALPVFHLEQFDLWLIFDYDGVKRALEDHATFSSEARPPGATSKPFDWLVFNDQPRHAKLRALVSRAFTPRIVADLESRIRQISGELLDPLLDHGEMELVADYSSQLPVMVIAELLGIPPSDRTMFKHWSDCILKLADTVAGGEQARQAGQQYLSIASEMDFYLKAKLEERRKSPRDDLLSKLVHVEVDGARLTHEEISGFFQLLLAAGSETTINLINNAMLCLLEHPHALARVREQMDLLPTAIEEVLRYRSPFQAVFRQTTRDVEMQGLKIPADKLVLPLIGSANRDPKHFENADCFDVARDPNPHIAFGHGIHFCLGAALSRLETRIALEDILARIEHIEFANDEPWEPRPAFHVHGPMHLPIKFRRSLSRGKSAAIQSAHA